MKHLLSFLLAALFLVEYGTVEKCYECNYRYPVVCTNATGVTVVIADCGVPDKTVSHFQKFESLPEMLNFLNRTEMPNPPAISASLNSGRWLPKDAKVVGVWELIPASVKQSPGEIEVEVLRPVKIKEPSSIWSQK